MNFKSKDELIEFIEKQTGVRLPNVPGFLNDHELLLYTEIPRKYKNSILSLLNKNGIQHNEHIHGQYWIYLDNTK